MVDCLVYCVAAWLAAMMAIDSAEEWVFEMVEMLAVKSDYASVWQMVDCSVFEKVDN